MNISSSTSILLAFLSLQASYSVTAEFDCSLPPNANKYSVITSRDATIGAHSMYKGLAVGGTLTDSTPSQSGTVDRTISLIQNLDANHSFNFNGGLRTGTTAVDNSMIDQFAFLARNAQNSNSGGKKVVVVTSGGTYNMYDFNNGGQGEDNGNTVVVFDTNDDITITKTSDGRQFGPSIIAPFSKVIVRGDAGFVDGFIMAKSFETTGGNQGSLQLHGDTYTGGFQCGGTEPVDTPVPPLTSAPVPAPIVPPTPQNTCVAQWGACTGATESCCDGLQCVGDQYYAQCSEALSTPSDDTCITKWGACTGAVESCCESLQCVGNQYYAQCLDAPPTSSPPPPTPTTATTPKVTAGGGGGDPHFKTWTGQKFDYHGECDLVLIQCPAFANGLGLNVHIRTTRVNYFSFIERIAVNIGSDVLEFDNDLSNWLLNGEKSGDKAKLAGYEIRKFQKAKAISVRLNDKTRSKIDLFHRRNGMPYVVVDGGHDTHLFQGGLGLIGDFENGQMIARDGSTEIKDATEFALEWQVRDTEPTLFQSVRSPQFPQVCTPPKKHLRNRLGDSHMRKKAEEECEAWKDDKEDCIFDVMATRDLGGASAHPVHHAALATH